MKYIITEEQSTKIEQSKINMGPLGSSIRRVIDLLNVPLIDKYIVIYIEENNTYLVLLWSKRGYINDEHSWELTKQVQQFVPVDITIISAPLS